MEHQYLTEEELDLFRCGSNRLYELNQEYEDKEELLFSSLIKNFQEDKRSSF